MAAVDEARQYLGDARPDALYGLVDTMEHGWRVPPRMTTKDLRVAWCDHLNLEMERHGLDVRFDQRRLKEQGIDYNQVNFAEVGFQQMADVLGASIVDAVYAIEPYYDRTELLDGQSRIFKITKTSSK